MPSVNMRQLRDTKRLKTLSRALCADLARHHGPKLAKAQGMKTS
jgi:hypothetical protein